MFDGHILHVLFSKHNVHAAIPGVTTEDTLLLSKLNKVFIISSSITSSRRNGYKQYITVMMNKKHNRERHKAFILSILT